MEDNQKVVAIYDDVSFTGTMNEVINSIAEAAEDVSDFSFYLLGDELKLTLQKA